MSKDARALVDFLEHLHEKTGKNLFKRSQFSHISNVDKAVKELVALGLAKQYITGSIDLDI